MTREWLTYALGLTGRFAATVGVLAMLGALVVVRSLLPAASAGRDAEWRTAMLRRTLHVGKIGPWLLLFAATVRGISQLLDFADPDAPLQMDQVRGLMFDTTWGHGWSAQVVAAIGALAAWLLIGRGRLGLAALVTIAAAVADALTGHGMAGRWAGVIGVSLHASHLIGAGIWIGALAVASFVFGVRPSNVSEANALSWRGCFAAFTPWALVGGAMVVIPGVIMGLEYAGGVGKLLTDGYGQLLVAKAALAGAVLLAGAWHWRFAVPRLPGSDAGRSFAWSVTGEVAVAWAIVAVTAVLVALPAPGV